MSTICSDTVAKGIVSGLSPIVNKYITIADSPYFVTRQNPRIQVINVDASGVADVIVKLYGLTEDDSIEIKKTDSSDNMVKYSAVDGTLISDSIERTISEQYNSDRLIGTTTQWRRW